MDVQPQPRYYRVRPRRHRVLGGLAVAALGVGAGVLIIRSDLVVDPETADVAEASDQAAPLVPGEVPDIGSGDRSGDETPQPVTPAEVEFDVGSVTVVGDSITAASVDAIRATLSAEDVETVDVHGKERRRIEIGNGSSAEPLAGIEEIYQLIADGADPDVWVIALGTNDVGQYPDAEAYGRLVDTVLGMIPEDVPVVWVDAYRPDEPEHTAIFNEVLHDRIDDRENSAVAPWHAFASSDQTILRKDDLHPNASGTEVFAAVITAGIADALD